MFTELPAEEQAQASEVLENCKTQAISTGDVRPAAAFQGAALVFIEEGVVLVETLPSSTSRAVAVDLAGPGTPLLPPAQAERLRALTDVQLMAVASDTLDRLLRIPGVAAAVVERLADQVRESRESLSLEGAVHHVDRVRAKLLHLARSHGRVVAAGEVRLELPLTHDLLAHMVGSSRGTITRALAELESGGFLRRHGRSLVLIIPPEDLA